jgi:hypothetical protein
MCIALSFFRVIQGVLQKENLCVIQPISHQRNLSCDMVEDTKYGGDTWQGSIGYHNREKFLWCTRGLI